MSKGTEARETMENSPIQKAVVGDIEVEYKAFENKSSSDKDDIPPFLLLDCE